MNETHRVRHSINAVKELIHSRGLGPGDPMPTESELTQLLGVSRSSLREAVRTLVALDILEVRHGTGTFVGEMSLRPLVEGLTFRGLCTSTADFETLRQVIEVRSALDHALAPGMVAKLTGKEAPELRALCTAMQEKSQRGEIFAEEDRAFHLLLARTIGNELYGQLVGAFWDIHAAIGPRLGVPTPRDIADTVEAHQTMLEAALAGDLAHYQAAVTAHYAPLLRVLSTPTA